MQTTSLFFSFPHELDSDIVASSSGQHMQQHEEESKITITLRLSGDSVVFKPYSITDKAIDNNLQTPIHHFITKKMDFIFQKKLVSCSVRIPLYWFYYRLI